MPGRRTTPGRPGGALVRSCRQAFGGLPSAAELAALGQFLEGSDQAVDLVGGVGSGQLDAESDLVLGNQRVGGERDVDAALEEQAADLSDALVVAQRDLHD